MNPSLRYPLLLILGLGIIALLAVTFSGPVIYSLEMDIFPSLFHENTDALKIKALNSTTDILPLMQDLLDYSGPIVLNINIRDMDQFQYYLDMYSKNNINLKNLVINLDMTQSEMDEFSKNKLLQQRLLRELMNSTISIDELDSLMITYRDDNDMLMSLKMQREAIRKQIHALMAEYQLASEKTQKIADKLGLDKTSEKESVTEFKQIVDTIDEKIPPVENPLPRIPTISLLVKPESGKYGDRIAFSGFYSPGSTAKERPPVSIFVDSHEVTRVNTDQDGIYSTFFEIEHITPGEHSVYATSGIALSGIRTFLVIPVNSTTSLDILAVYNKPEILCTGEVVANRQVRNAPVDIITDFRNILQRTTDAKGQYTAQIRLSPGIHHIQTQFVNATYPVYLSKSMAYEVEAGRDSIMSIRLLDSEMSADELSLTVDPVTATYKDFINISGTLSGKNPKSKTIDLFIDGVNSRSLQTGSDGSYAGTYSVEKMRVGTHSLFARYHEPGAGEIYSESRQIVVNATDTITTLDIAITDGGTGVICTGNVTAHARGVSSAPLELVWDNRNIIPLQTDAAGSFHQKINLPAGNHSIFARFRSSDNLLLPSQSRTQTITVLPPIVLYVRPQSVHYRDEITIGGSIRGITTSGRDVLVFIDGKKLGSYRTDAQGNYSTQFPVETIPGGIHRVYARYGEYISDTESFTVLPVNSTLSLSARLTGDNTQVICSGQLLAAGLTPVRSVPITLIRDGKNPVATTTDEEGRFEETLSLPAGNHQLIARFENREIYPVQSSESDPVNLDIPNPISLQVQPDHGMYRDTVTITGEMNGTSVSGRTLQMFIDGQKIEEFRSDSQGSFKTPYVIEQIPGGMHTIQVRSGDVRSDTLNFSVIVTPSTTTLSAGRAGETSRVTCTGTVTANNQPVRTAPVILVWDETNRIRTMTDANGKYDETIVLPAGKHTIRAQFNSADIYPINPSESAPVDVEVPLPLTVSIEPRQGRYMDVLSIRGSLHTDTIAQQDIRIVIDGNLTGSVRTDSNGNFAYPYSLEKITAGEHSVYARYGDVSSEKGTFTVLGSDSTTTLSAARVGETSRVACTGTVTANNQPVRTAPVVLVWDETNRIRTMTDANGKYDETIVLPAGKHTIRTQFNSPDMYPINPSESAPVIIEIPQIITIGNLVLEVMPKEGRFMDHMTIRGVLSNTKPIQPVSVFIDGKLQGTYQTNNNGDFSTDFIIEEIRAGVHSIYAMSDDIQSKTETITVIAENTTTTLSAAKLGETSLVSCSGTVTANNKPVRSAPVTLIWDTTNPVRTMTDEYGNYHETIVLPPGKHPIKAQFNSSDIFPLYPSESVPVDLEIPLPLGFTIQPDQGRYLDILSIQGALHTEVVAQRDIQIVIDGKPSGTLQTDRQGTFTIPYTIEMITAGQHIVFARSGDLQTNRSTFTVIAENTTTTLSAAKLGETSLVSCTGTVTANNKPVRSAPVTLIRDGSPVIRTITNENGDYAETISFPAGKHQIKAQFNSSDIFPLYPSESALVDVEILAPLSVSIQPYQGKYLDELYINGSLHAEVIANRDIQLFIDDRLAGTYRTDNKGLFTTRYSIENITGGQHTLQAVSADIKSNTTPFFVLEDNSTTTLSVQRTPTTSEVSLSGNVTTNKRFVRAAPVTITWDGNNSLETFTDTNGAYRDSIILPAGIHHIQAEFNHTDIFPINPSKSPLVEMNISPVLSLVISPSSGIYKDNLTFEGTLIQPDTLESTVDLYLNSNLFATVKSDRTGRYRYTMTIDTMPPGKYTVQARSADLTSSEKKFQVLPVHSLTSLTIIPVNNSALYECSGRVMAFDHAGDIFQQPLTVTDAEGILASFWQNPLSRANRSVQFAPVDIISNNGTLLQTTTNADGYFSEVIEFPPGDNRVAARFNNGSFPIFSSRSRNVDVMILSADITTIPEAEGTPIRILEPLLIVAVLLLFIGGAVFYLNRKSPLFMHRTESPVSIGNKEISLSDARAAGPPSPEEVQQFRETSAHDLLAKDPIFVRYLRVFETEGLSTAARTVYVHFTETIAQNLHIRSHRALTPREFLQACNEKPFMTTFSSFIAVYERVRYGGVKTQETRSEFEESLHDTDNSLEGEDH